MPGAPMRPGPGAEVPAPSPSLGPCLRGWGEGGLLRVAVRGPMPRAQDTLNPPLTIGGILEVGDAFHTYYRVVLGQRKTSGIKKKTFGKKKNLAENRLQMHALPF